jgi:hypothetical protein
MWHENHYPRLHDLIDILDAKPRSAPGDPPTQAEEHLARALEELKITPQIEDNIQKRYTSLHDQKARIFGCCSCGMPCILPSVSTSGLPYPPHDLRVFPTDDIFTPLKFTEEEVEEWNELSVFKQHVRSTMVAPNGD